MVRKFLRHYGTPRHSGRYPWGSGNEPYQDGGSITSRIDALRRKGFSEKEAAHAIGMSIADVRAQRSLEKAEKRASDVSMAQGLKAKGMSINAIGERMNRNESSIRSLLDLSIHDRAQITKNTTEMLKSAIGKDSYVDVGSGIEIHLGISSSKLKTSIKALQNEGYELINIQVNQLGTDKKTTVKVLAPKGTTYKDVVQNKGNIRMPQEYSEDGGRTFLGIEPPVSVSSKRIQVNYAENGGTSKDGLIELRRGEEDLSLGHNRYAQVRIAVDKTHYLKGMALHVDDLPAGVDIRFNTSKSKEGSDINAFKELSDDSDNPFGATIKQAHYIDSSGKERLSPINVVGGDTAPNEEGRWAQWTNNLSSQILSKQPTSLAKQQLGRALDEKKAEFDNISKLTNPVVKRRLLNSLGDDADAAAGNLKAAALPRQMNHVLLPVPKMPDHQVYAPNYKNGEKVVLLRHPHGGKFEIPELTVNNNHASAKRLLGRARDAVGISPTVAQRLSGADFDGDHVLVIPNPGGSNRIQTSSPLMGLKDFDPINEYPHVEGMKVLSNAGKQREMGDVSNLITDMTIKAASPTEIARAVRHSMVVIDAEKHSLNHKLSAERNGIAQLKEKYQGGKRSGASTLISKAGADIRVPHRKEGQNIGPISKETGKRTRLLVDPQSGRKVYTPTGETYRKGDKIVDSLSKVGAMENVTDAHELSSGTTMEGIYADYANALKQLGNQSRKAALATKNIPYSPAAKKKYHHEVGSLTEKLKAAVANKPLERRAQILANEVVTAKRQANPDLSRDDLKKLKGQALTEARRRVGAKKPSIVPTPKEWVAIQNGAVSPSFLEKIVSNSDLDSIRALATPRTTRTVSAAKIASAKALAAQGYTMAEIGTRLGVSASTVSSMLN